MIKEEYERLGALQKIIYDFINNAVESDDYEIRLDTKHYVNGYVDGALIIGGISIRLAYNKDSYICWLGEEQFKQLVNCIPGLEEKLCNKIAIMVEGANEEERAEKKKQRIAELEEELRQLKEE